MSNIKKNSQDYLKSLDACLLISEYLIRTCALTFIKSEKKEGLLMLCNWGFTPISN